MTVYVCKGCALLALISDALAPMHHWEAQKSDTIG